MTRRIELDTYFERCEKLRLTYDWIKSTGASPDGNRFAIYRKQMEMLEQARLENDYEKLELVFSDSDYANLVIETSLWTDIHSGLKDQPHAEFLSRLQKALKSHMTFSRDTANTSGRDFAYELYIGSLLSRGGLRPKFPASSDQPDVEFELDSQLFSIGCKRPRSSKKIHANVKDALNQLQRSFDREPHRLGLIAICLDKLVNPELGYLSVESEAEGAQALEHILSRFEDRFRHYWHYEGMDHRVLGAVLTICSPIYVKPKKLTLAGNFMAVSVLDDKSLKYKGKLLDEIYQRLIAKTNLQMNRTREIEV
jgi:hypothetical protein